MNATSSAPVRLVRGLGALVLLAVVLVGLPWLLVRMGQLHDPRTWSWHGFIQLFTTRDNGSTLLGVVTLIAWLAWLVFAIATVAELVVVLSRQQISIRLPGLHGAQLVAGGLLLAVAAMVVSPLQAAATPGDPAPAPRDTPNRTAHVQTVDDDNQAPTDNQHAAPRHAQSRRPASVVYTVKAGDDLWSLADQFYGDGAQWRKIAHANHTLLSGGPDELLIGWELTIPDVPAAPSSPGNSAASAATTVTVRPGDTLSSIADAHYGEAGRWTMIFDANRGVISDPDRIEVGWQLELPAVGQQEPAQHDQNQAGHRTDQHRSDRHPGAGEDPGRPAAPKTRPTAPPSEQPSPGGTPTQAQSGDATSQPGQPPPAAAEAGNPVESLVAAGSIGGLLAASLLSGLLARREWQLMHRPIGRRIPQPAPVSQRLESAIGRQSEPLTLQSLDLAMRAIARHCQASGAVPPDLELVLADENRIDFQLSGPVPEPPTGFAAVASGWRLDRGSQAYLESIPGIGSAPRLWPALISVGRAPSVGRRQQQADRTEAGSHVLINLEAAGVFTLRPASDQSAEDSAAQVTGALTAVAMELSFSWWASDLRITVVGRPGEDEPDWLAALGLHNVSWTTDIDQVISRAEVRARAQRAISSTTRTAAHPDGPPLSAHRLDPATADAWTPELLVCTSQLRADHVNKLERLLLEGAPVSLAAVRVEDATVADLTGRRAASSVSRPSKDWSMELRVDGPGRLEPAGLTLLPQLVETQVRSALVDLVATTGRDDTVPASWWWQASRGDGGEPEPPRPAINSPVPGVETPSPTGARPDRLTPAVPRDGVDPSRAVRPDNAGRPDNTGRPDNACDPENVTFLHSRHPADLLDAGQSNRNPTSAPDPTRHVGAPRLSEETAPMTEDPRPAGTPAAPVVRLLGPIDLLGAGGPPPPRATMQCVEYCAWLLEHPGATAMQMADALCIAEGTRRSNMSRLRTWLGDDAGGEPYLPDAYSGRIRLSSVVSSDWLRLQLLVSGGVNRASRTALVGALELVRGAPLADAAPGQWYWAEEMRTDMVSMIRDIGIELARLAIDDKEIDLARWAAHRGLAAAPGDELLMCERIRTEFSAGNPGEMERLVLQVQGRARSLGVDLHTETVELMQQVVEGHLRIRQA